MMSRWFTTFTSLYLLLVANPSASFVVPPPALQQQQSLAPALGRTGTGTVLYSHSAEKLESSFLLQEFRTASGEVIHPYTILKISRKATREQVRMSYIALSRRYHPDGFRHRKLLPGNCNNLEEVRDQWERIKLSYEILSDSKMRKKYDRNEALADPGAAVQRAAVSAAFDGLAGMGKGLFGMGAFAVQNLSKQGTQKAQEATAD